MTSYQKLKAKNTKLEKELNILALRPDSVDALLIKSRREFVHQQAESAMFGSRALIECTGTVQKIHYSPGTHRIIYD